MYSLTLELDIQKTDPNRLLGCAPALKHRLFSVIKRDIKHLCHGKAPAAPLERFLLSVVRHGPRPLDYDNLIASLKAYIDGLTLAGIIVDDSWQYIKHISVEQEKSKQKKLVLTIEEF
jgi:Holliday junction resolvase RusA-like endonuclease